MFWAHQYYRLHPTPPCPTRAAMAPMTLSPVHSVFSALSRAQGTNGITGPVRGRTPLRRPRRTSLQMLLAAASPQQYRELPMANRSGRLIEGMDFAIPRRYKDFENKSFGSLSPTERRAKKIKINVNAGHASHMEDNTVRLRRSMAPSPVSLSSGTLMGQPPPDMADLGGGNDGLPPIICQD